MKLIHYGSNKYDPTMVYPIQNSGWVKPTGGLWTSPIDSEWGWKHWCEAEWFRECNKDNSFVIDLNSNAKILVINSLHDLKALPLLKAEYGSKMYPDFYILSKQYDAIHLTEKGQQETRMTYPINLYGWDVETVFIMNPDCVYRWNDLI